MTLYLVLKYLHIVGAAVLLGTGAFWLPVVWMQMRLRDIAREAAMQGTALPDSYHRLFRAWFWCGFPAFASVMTILWLMIAKPVIIL